MRKIKVWGFSLALVLVGLAPAGQALAHKLLVSGTPEAGGGLKVQAFFPDGKPAQEIPVAVIPAAGGSPRSGKTDHQGVCSFTGLAPGQYRLEAGDALGHRAVTQVVLPGPAAEMAPPAGNPAAPLPRGEPLPWGNILAGLGFIFGVSAFLMVLRLRAEVRKHASRD
jgi:hypothetical protein